MILSVKSQGYIKVTMDLENMSFGKGPKELTGAVHLVHYYKLFPHYEFFCNKASSLSVSDAHYLHHVVGDTEIRKGQGMQLIQLVHDSKSVSRQPNICIHAFDLNALGDAFHLRETALVDSQNGISTQAGRSKSELKDKEKKHKKYKDKQHRKHKHYYKDKKNENDKISHHDSGTEHLKKTHEKKRKVDGDGDLSGIHRHQNIKYKRSKMDEFGVIRIAA